MPETKVPTLETVKGHIERLRRERKNIFGPFTSVLVEYSLYLDEYNKAVKEKYPETVINRYVNLMQEQKNKGEEILKALKEKDQQLDKYIEKLNKLRNMDYSVALPDPVSFEIDKFDEVEKVRIEEQKELIKQELLKEDNENAFHEGELKDEDLLAMNPPTIRDYEVYLQNLKEGKFYPSKKMARLLECRENDLIYLELIDAKIEFLAEYEKYYSCFHMTEELQGIADIKTSLEEQREIVLEHSKSIEGSIGNEGKNIKKALQEDIDYYSNKLTELKNDRGYGKK